MTMMEDSRIGRVVGTAGSPMYPSIADHWALHMIKPTGHLPFGTKVTVQGWDGAPVPGIILSCADYGNGWRYDVYVKGDGGVNVSASRLTLGWLPSRPDVNAECTWDPCASCRMRLSSCCAECAFCRSLRDNRS